MKLYSNNSSKEKNQGFTLIEMLASVIILGVIAAIAAPNLMAMFSHHKVNNAISIINGAIQETQRQAVRQGISCTVTLDTVNRTMTGNPASCLPEQRVIDDSPESTDDLTIRSNISPAPATLFNIVFSAKGTTTTAGTIIVASDSTDTQRCFSIALGLGIARTGMWDPTGGAADKTSFNGDCNSN